MRKLIAGLALLLGVFFIINQFTQLESIIEVARRGDWRYLGLSLLAQALWFVATAGTLAAVFTSLGRKRSLASMVLVGAAANFINIVAPSGGMSGLAVLVSDARHHQQSGARATVAGALFVLSEYISFFFFLALGLLVFSRRGSLDATELAPAGFLVLMTALLATGLYLGMRSEQALARALTWGVRLINKIIWPFWHRQYLSESRAEEFATETAEALTHLRQKPYKVLPALLYSVASKTAMLLVMLLMFLAFDVQISVGTLFASFTVAYLFVIVSPTPAGIGVVEGLLTLSLVSFSIPVGAAAVVVLGYRAVTFWLPLLVGMLAFQVLQLRPDQAASGQ